MVELREIAIGDLGRIVTGRTPPGSQPALFGELYPFLTPSDIDGLARYIEPERFLSPEGRDHQSRAMLPEHAVCVVCIGATIGKVCMTSRPSFTNQQINSIVVNENEHNPFYVFCLMRTLLEELKSRAGGAATPIINKSTFSAIEIRVPPLPVQHRIASILSAYDDLIGNNTRRIAILEEMAQAIYREWFVNFGFPGHEDVEMVESELGEIPEGWEVGDLRAIAHLQRESVRPQAHPDEVFEYYSIPAFDAGRSPMLEPGNQIRSSKYLVPEGSILVSKLNPRIPRVWIFHGRSDHRAVGSTEFLPLVSRTKSHRSFLYALLNSTEWGERLAVRAGGTSTSHQRVKPGDFMRMPFPIPHQKLVKAYSDAVNPFFELIEILRRGSDTLRETRDLLLPRLVSGEINVNEFSEELEEAIA